MRAILTAWLLLVATSVVAQPLPRLALEEGATTVSGLSSGAFMAVQLQIAHSAEIAGAGIVAGGPYDCAGGSVYRALFVCMDQIWWRPDPARSLATIERLSGEIDPPAGIAPDRAYLFHGRADDTVGRPAMDALAGLYDALGVAGEDIRYVTSVEAGHGFLTERGEVACAATRPDFLNDCGIDQAGEILDWLLGPLSPPVEPVLDNLQSFDQTIYAAGALGLDARGFVYVPESCASGAPCRLHVALHGCKQGRERIGDRFARLTGYNGWAEANGLVILYPQAATVPAPFYYPFGGNPNGCWDWWGYSGRDHLSRTAPQIAAIARMAGALGAGFAE